MRYAQALWYGVLAFAIMISWWAGIRSVGYFVAGQFPQFFVFGLLSFFCATFVIGSKPWLGLGTRRFSNLTNLQPCPHCGYSNLSSNLYCQHCGSSLRTSDATLACSSCHREIQASFRYCPFCGNSSQPSEDRATISQLPQQLPRMAKTCVTCGASIVVGCKFCATCGQPLMINVKEVLNSTLRIIRTQPIIIVPIFIELLASNLLTLFLTPVLAQLLPATNLSSPLASIWGVLLRFSLVNIAFGLTVTQLVRGMYPSMVENVVGANRISITQALRRAVRKFKSLFVSHVLASLAILVGSLLLLPGLIMATW